MRTKNKKLTKSSAGTAAVRQPYPTDLTDKQWEIIKPLIPAAKSGGRERTTDIREILNAVFYVLKSGCDWRMLPHDFPKWQTVYDYFNKWKDDGTWEQVHNKLRDKVRLKAGKHKQPTAGIMDSQSVKTAEKGGFVGMMLVKR
jgi:putative transposase